MDVSAKIYLIIVLQNLLLFVWDSGDSPNKRFTGLNSVVSGHAEQLRIVALRFIDNSSMLNFI